VVRASVLAHQDHAAAKSLSLSLELDLQDEQTLVRADEEALRQIFDNLIDNAVKYTPEGGRVSVSCRISDDAQAVLVEVSDTGIGIPREDLPRVFERFYRVDKARSRELGGTGLGLAIVKHTAHCLGGKVTVSSRLGAGSRFTVRLPMLRQGYASAS
jgi:two-component system phosphate regulon sensor histidine kinase PhoR